ncbi:hypothetical protein K437DRAFT_266744 [Tilletiaria anomala UBC 951]|uniref:Uncharacterized protein n=1 Tax=Tilletiaria anomala (strain ATCC 24038 / CBS 436.72 / UBC 951) TaxID=1037660 RepID=A0A066WEN9_TILAU|nr:uncharacterized protein K437DRAFT_266744 [Tilletiaria anomala UBC 951]KDN52387.1 hypothetical protein K437DRAFT_266744 [Tilletiaria anomala UBC 951]
MPLKAPIFTTRKSAQDVREGRISRVDLRRDGVADAAAAIAPKEQGTKHPLSSVGTTGFGVDGCSAIAKPKTFGFGLGLSSFSNSVSKAGDKMSSLTRKQGAAVTNGAESVPGTPTSARNSPPQQPVNTLSTVTSGKMAPPANPDPQLLAHYSLKLSDLVNKAFLPCAPGAAAMNSAVSVSSTVAGAAKVIGVGVGNGIGGQRDTVGIPTLSIISYEGKKLPDKIRVQELAQTVTEQLHYAASVDSYLLRAVARQVLKALTLFATRIDSLLISSSKDPNVLKIPSTPKEGRVLPAAMEFNIGLIAIEWIVEDSLERCLEGDGDEHPQLPRFVSEILTPVRRKMEGTILHVIQPILSGTKMSITTCIQKAVTAPFTPVSQLNAFGSGAPADQKTPGSPAGTVDGTMTPFKSLVSPGDVSPSGKSADGGNGGGVWVKELDGRLAGCRRMLVARIENRTSKDGEGWFISVTIYIIWKALFILSARNAEATFMCSALGVKGPLLQHSNGSISAVASPQVASLLDGQSAKRNPSPAQLSSALKAVALTGKGKRSEPVELSRPNSGRAAPDCWQPVPDGGFYRCRKSAQIIAELQTVERLVKEFCSGFYDEPARRRALSSHVVVAPSVDDEDDNSSSDEHNEVDELARAALAEALHGLKSIVTCVQVLEVNPEAVSLALRAKGQGRDTHAGPDGQQVLPAETVRAFRAAPPLILLHILYNRLPTASGRIVVPSPPEAFGLSWQEYEKSISGFIGAHTWADALLQEWKPLVEAAWQHLSTQLEEAERLQAAEDQQQQETKPNDRANMPSRTGQSHVQEPEGHALRRSASQLSNTSRRSSGSTCDYQHMTQSTSAIDTEHKQNKEARMSSREPSPDADSKERHGRTPLFWRTHSGSSRGFSLSTLSRTASPRPRGPSEMGIIVGPNADAAVTARFLVEEMRTEKKALRRFGGNLEAIALHMGKEYTLSL